MQQLWARNYGYCRQYILCVGCKAKRLAAHASEEVPLASVVLKREKQGSEKLLASGYKARPEVDSMGDCWACRHNHSMVVVYLWKVLAKVVHCWTF